MAVMWEIKFNIRHFYNIYFMMSEAVREVKLMNTLQQIPEMPKSVFNAQMISRF